MTRRQLLLSALLAAAAFYTGNMVAGVKYAAPVVKEVTHAMHPKDAGDWQSAQGRALQQAILDRDANAEALRMVERRLRNRQETASSGGQNPTFADVARAWGITGRLDCAAVGAGAVPHAFDERLGTLK